jgi:hypothetical protein
LPIIPVLERMANLKPAWATEQQSVSKTKQNKNEVAINYRRKRKHCLQ